LAGFLYCSLETSWQRFGQFLNDFLNSFVNEFLDENLNFLFENLNSLCVVEQNTCVFVLCVFLRKTPFMSYIFGATRFRFGAFLIRNHQEFLPRLHPIWGVIKATKQMFHDLAMLKLQLVHGQHQMLFHSQWPAADTVPINRLSRSLVHSGPLCLVVSCAFDCFVM